MGLFSAVVGVVKDISKRKPKRPARPVERKQAPRPVQPRPAPRPVQKTEKPKPKPPQKVTPTPKPKTKPKQAPKPTRKKNRRRARILRSKQKELARLKKERAIAEQIRRKKLQQLKQKPIKKPVEEPIDWGLSPEEEMLASMTVDEVKEYIKNADIDKLNTNVDFFADAVINNYRSEVHQYPSHAEPIITKWLNSLIDEWGKQAVAEMLQRGAEAGVILTRKIAYDDDKLEGYLSDMLNYMPEMTDGMREMIMDNFDSWSDVN